MMMLQQRLFLGLSALLLAGFLAVTAAAPALATEQNTPKTKTYMIMYEQESCTYCEIWNEQIGKLYGKTNIGKAVPLRRVDIHKTIPADIKHIRKEYFTPSFVVVHENKEIGRIRGYPSEDFFWGLLEQIVKKIPGQAILQNKS